MKPSELLREAAWLLERRGGGWSCIALQEVAGLDVCWWREEVLPPVGDAYAVLLGRLPTEKDYPDRNSLAGVNERVIALGLAAAIAESEGQ